MKSNKSFTGILRITIPARNRQRPSIINKIFLLPVIFLILGGLYSCDGIFLFQSKSNVPSDYKNNRGGALHTQNTHAEACKECHGYDLRKKVNDYEEVERIQGLMSNADRYQ
ncbi:MAG: hypothetical protein JSS91_06930 [Bacteroidetes bacterium]|nr:hypothetical protein [Bacteroidota bacterium]